MQYVVTIILLVISILIGCEDNEQPQDKATTVAKVEEYPIVIERLSDFEMERTKANVLLFRFTPGKWQSYRFRTYYIESGGVKTVEDTKISGCSKQGWIVVLAQGMNVDFKIDIECEDQTSSSEEYSVKDMALWFSTKATTMTDLELAEEKKLCSYGYDAGGGIRTGYPFLPEMINLTKMSKEITFIVITVIGTND